MEWVASTLHTVSEYFLSSVTAADVHTSAASSRQNGRPRRFKWTRPFRRKTKYYFCACAITFQLSTTKPLSRMERLGALVRAGGVNHFFFFPVHDLYESSLSLLLFNAPVLAVYFHILHQHTISTWPFGQPAVKKLCGLATNSCKHRNEHQFK